MGRPKLRKNLHVSKMILHFKHFLSSRPWLSATGSCKRTTTLQEGDEHEPTLQALRERMPQ